MLALHGMDAYGLEVSQTAVSAANTYAEAQLAHPSAANFSGSAPRPPKAPINRGKVKFVEGDFFMSDWMIDCLDEGEISEGFDLIYDYTFLCAIPPSLRSNWARRMKELLSPTGILICLEFPLWKELDAVGPPYGLNGVYWNLLAEGGDGVLHDSESTGAKQMDQGQGPFERVLYYKPERSYDQGRGTDMVSVWKLS